jgi:hypothetical protein
MCESDMPARASTKAKSNPLTMILVAACAGALFATVLGVSTSLDLVAPPAVASPATSESFETVNNPFAQPVDVKAMSAEEAATYVAAIASVDRDLARARARTDADLARLSRLSRHADEVFAQN